MDKAQQSEQQHHFQIYKRFPVTFVSGKGAILTDSNGKQYIDALTGIAVNSLGHCHPVVVDAIQSQSEKLIHISNLYYNEPQSKLAQLLTKISGLDRVLFTNSGAEAMESALKLTRRYAHNKGRNGKIISIKGCFHGRTLATLALGKAKYQDGFAPIPEGFGAIPREDIAALEKAISNGAIAIVIEAIQGEGGIVELSDEYATVLSDLCKQNDTLLICDEIQCGMARTGKMFGYQHYDLQPDITTIAKALGGGFPIGAMLASERIASGFEYGSHGTTFGGNPLACSAAVATLEYMLANNLTKQAQEKGTRMIKSFKDRFSSMASVVEVRGKGLMIGIELNQPGSEVVNEMFKHGVLANCTEETVIRLLPPLICDDATLDKICDVTITSIQKVLNG